ncbi:hypothetical protein [Sphingomonas sp. PAMC 26605]|uniref:hypothetical protein n=1 Tax=Sphingomonas sp. PAMC 26605 TaxID=1112214 RepID=UPI00031F8AC4|nr:hypothetical protein [Sphingomonas sp. PAMC 26605]
MLFVSMITSSGTPNTFNRRKSLCNATTVKVEEQGSSGAFSQKCHSNADTTLEPFLHLRRAGSAGLVGNSIYAAV